MIKLWKILKTHFQTDFQASHYFSQLAFLATALFINFYFHIENKFLDADSTSPSRMLWYFLIYAAGFYFSCWIVSRFRNQKEFWSTKKFWMLSLSGLAILSVDKGFPFTHYFIETFSQEYQVYFWLHQIAGHAISFLLILVPLVVVYYKIDKEKSNFYGLTKASGIQSYIGLLLIMIPLVFIASLTEGFINYYPTYKHTSIDVIYGWPRWLPASIYELLYGISFLNVEILFRGFFVIGLSHVLGKQSILPMVCIYCFLHFGKPVGEAISSIAGGYILGVLAFYTRTIWGGVFVHVGVAWMMEAAAYWAKQSINS
jgi:hypothetical protein